MDLLWLTYIYHGFLHSWTHPDTEESQVLEHLNIHLRLPIMVQFASIVALCSTLFGVSRAAGQGTSAEYADGTVHARIMGLKMVRIWHTVTCRTQLIGLEETMGG